MNILIVDDGESARALLQRILRKEGHHTLAAGDGVEALELLRAGPVDAILADIMMPRMDGYRLCQAVRRDEGLKQIPVIIYTANYGTAADERMALDLGADAFLRKPAPAAEILATLRRVTSQPRVARPRPVVEKADWEVMQEYTDRLVAKLEERNTELVNLNHTLAENEARYRLLADYAEDFVLLYDPAGRRLYTSPSYYRMTGWTPEDIARADWHARIHPEDLPLVERTRAANLAGETTRIEHRIRCQDGRWLWVEARGRPVVGPEGRVTQLLLWSRDVTGRKEAEAEVLRLAAFPQLNPNPVFELTADGMVNYGNEAALALASELGYARPWEMLPPGTAAIVGACLGSGQQQQRLEFPYGKRVIAWSFYPVPTRSVVHCYAVEVTDRRLLEEQLRQSQKMEAIGQLAGGIAHDFNNILGAIIGNVELARTMPPNDPELLVSLEAIFAASRRGADLVKQILAFSHRQEQQRQPLQLALVVREVIKLLRATVPASVEFRHNLVVTATVLADPSAIHQVAMNLCTNAWHALPNQAGVIRVELAEAEVSSNFARQHPDLHAGRYVRLTVADNGCGMDAATRAHIFEPFFTTKPVGTGTGLGLAVVHGIMKSHDGGIVVTSTPGQGTTFDLYFPVLETPASASAAEPGPVPRGAGEHILFVDDEEALAKMSKRLLERLGYRVTVFTRPAEALAAFCAQPTQFDLIITDYNMPGMNGTTLGAELLAVRPEQRIILTTGFSADVTAEVARALGFCELLPKPCTMHTLGEAVQRVLNEPPIHR
ncbi:MAG: hypothetical protein RL514_2417 [Verrucomicrobiota bacterium]|jgi:PAS domain S-box-containing protein